MIMMQIFYSLAIIISLFSVVSTLNTEFSESLGKCLSELATQELSVAYNYLSLSSKFGTTTAYPGFSSLFTKLSDEDSSKGHELVKFLALRKAKVQRLINENGITIQSTLTAPYNIINGLKEARHHNTVAWNKVNKCHQEADTSNEANVQDYLESHLLDHHIEINKLLVDLEDRINAAPQSERSLIIFMIDEELLQTYGDRRKDIFS